MGYLKKSKGCLVSSKMGPDIILYFKFQTSEKIKGDLYQVPSLGKTI